MRQCKICKRPYHETMSGCGLVMRWPACSCESEVTTLQADVERLKGELEDANDRLSEADKKFQAWLREEAAHFRAEAKLRADNARLREALGVYGRHLRTCMEGCTECDCGLDALRGEE